MRAPLTSLLGLIEVMKLEKGDNYMDRLNMMQDVVQRLDEFIRDIVDYSYNTHSEPRQEDVDLESIIAESFRSIQHLPYCNRIKTQIDVRQCVPFRSDPRRIKVILGNLLSNAVKYQNLREPEPFINVSVVVDEKVGTIEVSDNGVGIGDSHQDKIFKMFYVASDQSGGSGLGLYIVRETVNKFGGAISFTSTLGKGTKFKVEIPNYAYSTLRPHAYLFAAH
jgi:signal transduction histidine kinase